MATIAQVKAGLGYPVLNLQRATKDGQPTEWLRHWDNDKRVAVSIHQDTLKYLQEHPECNQLGTQQQDIEPEDGAPYTAFRIVKYNTEIEASL